MKTKIFTGIMMLCVLLAAAACGTGGPVTAPQADAPAVPEQPEANASAEAPDIPEDEPSETEADDTADQPEDRSGGGQVRQEEQVVPDGAAEQDSGEEAPEEAELPKAEAQPEPEPALQPEPQPLPSEPHPEEQPELSDSTYQYMGLDGKHHDGGTPEDEPGVDPNLGKPGYEGPKEGYEWNIVRGYYKKDEVQAETAQVLQEAEEKGVNHYDFNGHTMAYEEYGGDGYDYAEWVANHMDYVMEYCSKGGITFEEYLEANHIS